MQTMKENTNNTPADCAARVELAREAKDYATAISALDPRELIQAAREVRREIDGRTIYYFSAIVDMTNGHRRAAALTIDTEPTGYNNAPTPSAFVFATAADTGRHYARAVARMDGRAKELAELISCEDPNA